MPKGINVNERCSFDIELKQSLQMVVHALKIWVIGVNLVHFEDFRGNFKFFAADLDQSFRSERCLQLTE